MKSILVVALVAPVACSEYGLDRYAGPPDAPGPTDASLEVVDEPDDPTEPVETLPDEETPDRPGTAAEPPADDCADTSDLIYVIDRAQNKLYLFDPLTLDFTAIGALNCASGQATPASMAVSRDGFAYVRFSDNDLYAVDLVTLDCSKTPYQSAAFGDFGMGFSTDAAGGWVDTLYLSNASDLATLDLATWTLQPVGATPSQSELSGDADGELWAFLPLESPAELTHLDKAGGPPIVSYGLNGFPDAGDIDTFAFATWAGDFWLFVREYGMGKTTDVYHVTADGDMALALGDSGRDVVGAGVSTCAPTE